MTTERLASITGEAQMRTHRFGRKLRLPSTIAIKHEIRKLMFEDAAIEPELRPIAEMGWRPGSNQAIFVPGVQPHTGLKAFCETLQQN